MGIAAFERKWGAFTVKLRDPDPVRKFGVWEARCLVHSQHDEPCARSTNVPDGTLETRHEVHKKLLLWCNTALDYANKEAHMRNSPWDLPVLTEEALSEGKLDADTVAAARISLGHEP